MVSFKKVVFFILFLYGYGSFIYADFNFIVCGDSRPAWNYVSQPPIYKQILKEVNLIRPDFLIHTGDIVWGYGGEDLKKEINRQFDEFNSVMSVLSVPFYIAPGNHEIDPNGSAMAREIYLKKVTKKLYYSFNHKGSHFIFLNTDEADRGKLGKKQVQWLEKDLKKSVKSNWVFVTFHKPMHWNNHWRFNVGNIVDAPLCDWASKKERDKVWALFKKYGVDFIFNGHEHILAWYKKDGITCYITGGAGASRQQTLEQGGVSHYLLVKVPDNGRPVISAIEPNNIWSSDIVAEEKNNIKVLKKKVVWNLRHTSLLLQGIWFDLSKFNLKKEVIVSLSPSVTVKEVKNNKARVSIFFPRGKTDIMAVIGVVPKPNRNITPINISEFFNNDGVSTPENGSDGDFDGAGFSYAAEFLPKKKQIKVSGVPFIFPVESFWKDSAFNNISCSSQIVDINKKISGVYLLCSAEWGSRTGEIIFVGKNNSKIKRKFVVSDWCMSADNGEIGVVGATYRRKVKYDSIRLDPTPTGMYVVKVKIKKSFVRNIILPKESHLHIFGLSIIKEK